MLDDAGQSSRKQFEKTVWVIITTYENFIRRRRTIFGCTDITYGKKVVRPERAKTLREITSGRSVGEGKPSLCPK